MGKVAARFQERTDVVLFEYAALALRILDEFLGKSDVENAQSAQVLLVIRHQHRQFLLLQGKGQTGTDDVGIDIIGIVLGHQSRRDIDAYYLGRTLVDIFHHRGESASQWFVESATKESVYHQRFCIELRRVQVSDNLSKFHSLCIQQTLLVGKTVCRQFVLYIKEVYTYIISILAEHSRHSKRIAAVISRTGENNYWSAVRPFLFYGACQRFGCTFHQVERTDRFVLNGVFIQLMNLSACENLHII